MNKDNHFITEAYLKNIKINSNVLKDNFKSYPRKPNQYFFSDVENKRQDKENHIKNNPQSIIKQYIENGNEGNLDLSDTSINSLPKNLTVNGDLNLNNTPIDSLPENLTVNGFLMVDNTPITILPASLTVKKGIGVSNTPMMKKYSFSQIRAMSPNIKGTIMG